MCRCLDWQFDQLPLWTSYDDLLHVARESIIDHILGMEHILITPIHSVGTGHGNNFGHLRRK